MSSTILSVSVGKARQNLSTRGMPGQPAFPCVRVSVAATLLGMAVVALGGPQRASAEDRCWAQKFSDVSPSPRDHHALAYDSARGVTVLFGGRDDFGRSGETWEYDTCSGQGNIKKAACKDRNGANRLKVILVNGLAGDTFTVTLTDGSAQAGTLSDRGKGKAKFNNRPPGDTGQATAEWGSGARDSADYTCP